MKHFVYIDGSLRPEPQLWHDKPTDGHGRSKPVLFIKELSPEQESLTLDELTEIYKLEPTP